MVLVGRVEGDKEEYIGKRDGIGGMSIVCRVNGIKDIILFLIG